MLCTRRSRRALSSKAALDPNAGGGLAPNQLFTWRRLCARRRAIGAGEEVVAASEYRVLQQLLRELQRLLGKKTPENAILREALI